MAHSRRKENTRNRTANAPKAARNDKQRVVAKKRKSNRVIYYFILLLLVVGTIITLSLTVFFKIESVSVIGNEYYPNEEIIKSSGVEIGENLFLTSTTKIPDELTLKYPYLESVVVKRVLPPAIEIHVTQGKVAAAIELGEEEFALVSDTNKILERGFVLLPADVILVKGFKISDKQAGEYLAEFTPLLVDDKMSKEAVLVVEAENQEMEQQANYEKEGLLVIKYLNEAVANTEFKNLTNLDISNPLEMTVLYENRLLLKLGTELSLEYKLKFLKETIKNLDKDYPGAIGTLSAENATKNTEIIVTLDENYLLERQKEKLATQTEDEEASTAEAEGEVVEKIEIESEERAG